MDHKVSQTFQLNSVCHRSTADIKPLTAEQKKIGERSIHKPTIAELALDQTGMSGNSGQSRSLSIPVQGKSTALIYNNIIER